MTHTYLQLLYHFVWSTKNRKHYIDDSVKPRLYAYLRKAIRNDRCVPIVINGMPDHVHILLSARPAVVLPDLVRDLKTSTSKWMRSELNYRGFAWQEGYGAFTVGYSTKDGVIAYIDNQEEHHLTVSFADEYVGMLTRSGISFDPRFVLD